MKAHEYLLGANELLSVMPSLRSSEDASAENNEPTQPQQSFIELGRLWQAPMFEITLNFPRSKERTSDEGFCCSLCFDGLRLTFNGLSRQHLLTTAPCKWFLLPRLSKAAICIW